jgi:hypothetical protein
MKTEYGRWQPKYFLNGLGKCKLNLNELIIKNENDEQKIRCKPKVTLTYNNENNRS